MGRYVAKEATRASKAELCVDAVPIVRPYAIGVGVEEARVPGLWAGLLQNLEVPDKDTFELGTILTTFWLTRISQDASRGELRNRSVSNLLSCDNKSLVASGPAEFHETTQNHALVVRPDSAFVVLASLLAALLIGYIRLTVGPGGVLISGALVQLFAQILRFWTPPFGLLAFSFFPVCLGQGLQDSQANTFVSMIDKAHRWLGVIHGSYAIGGLCGPMIASAIAANFNGNWAAFYYVPMGIGALNLALCSYAFWDEVEINKAESTPEQRRSRIALVELKGAMKQKHVWLLSLFFFLYIGAALTMGGWIVEFLVVVRGGDLSRVSYIGAAFMGGTALGRSLLAEPTFRLGEKRMTLLYTIICLALQIVFWRVQNIVANAVIVCIMGFSLGPFFATGFSIASKLIPKEFQQSGLALMFVMAQAGGAIFPAITGVIAAQSGVSTLQPILVGILAALALSWIMVPSPEKRAILRGV
ncbi:Putative major facilitator superfamily, MFS transporter superfamily [Septoria linicola]|uniref:Major facilitator superfamily, MFS transporter superfamily n=1 Tax=Septoria linicola TaxID=215465 RepID=A0A9Q9EP34_9PEZI|nr:putative major facilitator superfamily, MFS transporter superfamily [Septoria linicola]USW57690.1 Putative major facilitator superfamily, MFS transporter superfamily [Septoria linicola]